MSRSWVATIKRQPARCWSRRRSTSASGRRLIEARERLVEQHQSAAREAARARARRADACRARSPDTRSSRALAEAGALERRDRPAPSRRRGHRDRRRTRGSRARSAPDRERDRAPSMPIRAPQVRAGVSRGALTVSDVPGGGASSVARIDKSVDLPAPLGPSRPTMSPASQVKAICESACAGRNAARR